MPFDPTVDRIWTERIRQQAEKSRDTPANDDERQAEAARPPRLKS